MALLSDTYLSHCYATHIQMKNAETASAFVSTLEPYLSTVDVHQIAHHFTKEAMRIFESHDTLHVSSRTHYTATCTLVFRIDSFFNGTSSVLTSGSSPSTRMMEEESAAASSAVAAHTLYVFKEETRDLIKSTFHKGTSSLTKDEEAALLQVLHKPGSYLRHFEEYLTTIFPSVRIQTKVVKDALPSQPFLYYGDPCTTHEPFWHFDMLLELPVITPTILHSVQDTGVVIRRTDDEEGEGLTNE